MISSVFSNYKDVVHVLPTKKKRIAKALYCLLKKTIVSFESIEFTVIALVTDNNAINRKAMSLFASPSQLSIVYPCPVDSSRPLFFVLDAVHIIKYIRNN